ncbi:type II toxin-antitoxin system Phd/YefM family antitoxin [Mycolicibacterium fortuitum]|nr:type II toxin-antitoxin system Phd/YefM family antitoxin [Mycolicibacterium fortuitum]
MATLTFRNRAGELVDVPTVAATQFKNEFAAIVEQAALGGAVAITKHNAPKAVLVSYAEFEALTRANARSSTSSPTNSTTCSPGCRHRRASRLSHRPSTPPLNSWAPPHNRHTEAEPAGCRHLRPCRRQRSRQEQHRRCRHPLLRWQLLQPRRGGP